MHLFNFFIKLTFYLIFIAFSKSACAGTVYIAPFGGLNPESFFYDENSSRDQCALPFCRLREALENEGYKVVFIKGNENFEAGATIISFNNVTPNLLGSLFKANHRNKRLLFVFEPPVVMEYLYQQSMKKYFDQIYLMLDDYVDNDKYFKFNYPQPRLVPIENNTPFDQKKFCALIAGNKKSKHPSELYSERVKTIKFFEKLNNDHLDLYGPGWGRYKCWKGLVESKWDTLSKYKFCICYENMQNQNGYITEKIFDCFVAKCVPIYWGASNIEDYVPANCFIDRRLFSSNQELLDYLENISEEEYEQYLLAAQHFLESPASKLFSVDYFVNEVLKSLSN